MKAKQYVKWFLYDVVFETIDTVLQSFVKSTSHNELEEKIRELRQFVLQNLKDKYLEGVGDEP